MVLNERVFRRGRETRLLPLLMVVGASNRLPEDDALGALFDRFLLRVRCDNVAPERLGDVLEAGWKLDLNATCLPHAGHRYATVPDGEGTPPALFDIEDIRRLNRMLAEVDLGAARTPYVELIHRLRHAGIPISDRRAVKLQRLLAASALLCGRLAVNATDLWVLRYIWDTEEQQEVLASIVADAIDRSGAQREASHPRAQGGDAPDPECLARDLQHIAQRAASGDLPATEKTYLKDRLGLLAARCQWVKDPQQREFLEKQVESLWKPLGVAT
jgi:MoxR-like ATPase